MFSYFCQVMFQDKELTLDRMNFKCNQTLGNQQIIVLVTSQNFIPLHCPAHSNNKLCFAVHGVWFGFPEGYGSFFMVELQHPRPIPPTDRVCLCELLLSISFLPFFVFISKGLFTNYVSQKWGVQTLLPPLSANISISETPPSPLSQPMSTFPQPPSSCCQPC